MKRKIISFVLFCVLVVSCFTISAFALTDEQKGPNYDTSHNANNDCPTFDTNGNPNGSHYDEGYEDGLTDGIAEGFEKGNATGQNNPSQEAIDSSIAEYKNSQEYKDYIQEQYNNGLQAGYNNASAELDKKAEQMYQIGLQDGYVEFQQSEQYLNTLNSAHQNGYSSGYEEGHADGLDYGTENSVKPGTLFALFGVLFALIIAILAITYFTRKKGKKKK